MKTKYSISNSLVLLLFIFILTACTNPNSSQNDLLLQKVDSALNIAMQQSLLMAEALMDKPDQLPFSTDANGKITTSNSAWWTSGFFPGTLWYLYENSNNEQLKAYAQNYTQRVINEKMRTWDHDGGFIIHCSFGNGYRITGDSSYRQVILQAAYSLASRFNSTIGCIRSWDKASWNEQWQYPVIVDNMMNLEMLMWVGQEFGQPNLKKVAETHAKTTMKNHFRSDNSSFHVVSYDTITGEPETKQTSQGYSNESAWARGQAWGLYGYTMMYRESNNPKFLNQAIKIADFLVNHPNIPEDKIPYWDFNAPDIPNALRDASAAAIMASALLELSTFSNENKAAKYRATAEKQIEILYSQEYLANKGENANYILKHSVGHMPNKTEVDVPIIYADYYFVEALMRYKKLNNKN